MHAAILRLESAGLLERDAQNRRVVLLRPTKQGRATMKTATRRVRALERSALSGLQRDEEQVVRGWLANVAAIARRGRPGMTLEDRIRGAEAELFATAGVSVDETFLDLARTGVRVRLISHGSGPPLLSAPRGVAERRGMGAVVRRAAGPAIARGRPSGSRVVGPGRASARSGPRTRASPDRRHPRRRRTRSGAGRRALARRDVRAVARRRRHGTDLGARRDRGAGGRAPGRACAGAAVVADRARPGRRRAAVPEPASGATAACSPRGLAVARWPALPTRSSRRCACQPAARRTQRRSAR